LYWVRSCHVLGINIVWNGILHFRDFLHTLCIQTDHSETSPLINRSMNASTMTTINPFHEPSLYNSTWAFLITSAAAYFNPFVFRCWNSYLITVICSLCSCCDSFTRADRPYLVHYKCFLGIVFHTSSFIFQSVLHATSPNFLHVLSTSLWIQQQHFPYDITSTADLLTPLRNATSYLEPYRGPQYGALHSESHRRWI
jgi:hypothetical protein